jgi:hypothetical protein
MGTALVTTQHAVVLGVSEAPAPATLGGGCGAVSTAVNRDLFLLAPKLVFHKLRSRQLDHRL